MPSRLPEPFPGRHLDTDVPRHLKVADAAFIVVKHLVRFGQGGRGEGHLFFSDTLSLTCVLGKDRVLDLRLLEVRG